MILTLDIGNTNIKTALFDGSDMKCYWRISTNRSMSSDEYGILLANLFQHNNADGLRHGDHDVLRRAERELYH